MNAFEYAGPKTLALAVQALGPDASEAISGGTDLLNRMKDYVTSPSRVVNLKTIEDDGFTQIRTADNAIRMGAGVTLSDLVANETVSKLLPALYQAAHEVGTPQIRNMATVGGNLCQRPRCWYFRHGHGLAGDVAKLIREGDNRYHAIYMTDGPALFVCPSSLAPPLIALNAQAEILGSDGKRTISVADLYSVPKSAENRELTLAPGEVISAVVIPDTKSKNASYEARQKQSHDWPLVLASVALNMQGDTVSKASIVLGSVAPVPLRATAAEEMLRNKALTLESAMAAAEAVSETAKPLSMNAYKVALVKTTVKRALMLAAGNRYWEA